MIERSYKIFSAPLLHLDDTCESWHNCSWDVARRTEIARNGRHKRRAMNELEFVGLEIFGSSSLPRARQSVASSTFVSNRTVKKNPRVFLASLSPGHDLSTAGSTFPALTDADSPIRRASLRASTRRGSDLSRFDGDPACEART